MTPLLQFLSQGEADDWIAGAAWSWDGSRILLTPGSGDYLELEGSEGRPGRTFCGNGISNEQGVYGPDGEVCLPGAGGKIRLIPPENNDRGRELDLGNGLIHLVRWTPDGRHFATAAGRSFFVLDGEGKQVTVYSGHKSSVQDVAWNPANSKELVATGDGGATMWRLGSDAPFARFDWGGASLIARWSPDGRWVVTGDQTPSVHLYDFTRDYPLHIQGYDRKVRALCFHHQSGWLATGGGPMVTIWNCLGTEGPEGSTPMQLQGHTEECTHLAYQPEGDLLASGGRDGLLMLWNHVESDRPLALEKFDAPITALAWSPDGGRLMAGMEDGSYSLFAVGSFLSNRRAELA